MDKPKEPMTVGQLIECLKAYPSDTLIMAEAADDYYHAPLTPSRISQETALRIGPSGKRTYDLWVTKDHQDSYHHDGDILEEKPCIVLIAVAGF